MTIDDHLVHMLALAEERYGPRDLSRSILPVQFDNGAPQIFLTDTTIQVQLGLNCAGNHTLECYQLAHEAIHILSPVAFFDVSTFEEGLATSFAHFYIQDQLRQSYPNSGSDRHDAAREVVEGFLAPRLEAVIDLRRTQPVISRITAADILALFPDVSPVDAQNLITLFNLPPLA